ncbi:MAG: FtsK/SpoIIIE domain-containing protein, partial [Phycisphaerales bacterium]
WFRFGTLDLRPADLPGGLPSDGEHHVEMPERIELPASLGFPARGNLLIETTPETRATAIGAVQALVARLLTSIPPSKVRFTFVDPVGLGENFAAFMRLGDEFEQLVGERIWTEPRAIEQKLTDLSEHMETVIQKYLRNEFNDIDAYNEAAGEIAEPYRFLVCADFPANFSDQAAVRMNSVLRAGQRCGVHVILLRDQKSVLPDGLGADAIAESCQIVRAGAEGFRFSAGPYADLPLALDKPLSDDALIPLLARIGREAKSAARVEVPFDVIAPKGDAMWSLSSARNLKVPIGRAGATRLQQFLLGEGTSQHALIAGKTGSGKSTLLHAIITGLATWYSPDEVELWLVDFKKGVEFKTYAEHALPHARAVAIESDREFGLSVLEGLDGELSRRGELFREAGVQDIASFRRERPTVRMPRILLVIDEFQEFFLDDDKVAQGASMLLDRLVRQGRAFGMHALLGSQTLGGAYSLARSTMGQMGVRIALQCSEADSQLILSDENLAARLLSRPGEAIYNDAGGRTEGNSPFQVAFLPDEKRDGWLSGVESKAKGAYDALPRIVFEGDARAAMKLHPASKGGVKPDPRGNVRLWFGEAVAIKDPTCARLAKAAGANVAIISSRDDQSVSSALAAILSIAVEAPDATIDVLDGTPADAPEYGMLERAVTERGIKASFTAFRDVESRIGEVAADVNERGAAAGRARRVRVIHQRQRYRALRRNEDDFSFGGSDGPPSTDKMLVGILREGPATGVHTVVTCDTLASLQRTFDRNTIREFDWKVLFQLSPSDSSSLIDSPAASRLGTNRGLLHSEELGLLEKFRPYVI